MSVGCQEFEKKPPAEQTYQALYTRMRNILNAKARFAAAGTILRGVSRATLAKVKSGPAGASTATTAQSKTCSIQ